MLFRVFLIQIFIVGQCLEDVCGRDDQGYCVMHDPQF